MVRSCRSGKRGRGAAPPVAAEPLPRPNAPPGILVPEDHVLADPPPPSFPPACSAEQQASALAPFEEADEEVIIASGVTPSTDDDMYERRHGGTRPSGDANANAAPPPVLNEAAGQVGEAASVRNDDPRRLRQCWEAGSVPKWAAVPKADDLNGPVGWASDGYVVLEAALPLSAVVPLLAMTRRQRTSRCAFCSTATPSIDVMPAPAAAAWRMRDSCSCTSRLAYPGRRYSTKSGRCGLSVSSVRCWLSG